MLDDTLNLLDFGTNENGDYVNLVEEEKRLKDISEKEFQKWLKEQTRPLVKIAYDLLPYSYREKTYNEIKEKIDLIAESYVYHYGNMEKDMYIYSLAIDEDDLVLVFQTNNHYLVNTNRINGQKEINKVLFGEKLMSFNATAVNVYDLKGNLITEYAEQDNKEQDIRYRAVINEWQMNKYGDNRMEKGKKIKDFYEVELSLPKLTAYWGENIVAKETEE